MLREFRNFILTGNVIEFAVAVIMAGAVGLVVNSFVTDIIMPIIGHFAGGLDFADMKYVLDPAIVDAEGVVERPENAIRYGVWINTIINLIIVGWVMFMLIRSYNRARAKEAEEAVGSTVEELLTEIRDILNK